VNRSYLSVTALLAAGLALAPVTAASAATTGSVGVSITSPITASGSKAVPVTCTTGPLYKASVSKAVLNGKAKGDTVSLAVSVAGYKGPGSYPAVVTFTLKEANGTVIPVPKQVKTPAVITSTGGSFTLSVTSTQGKKETFAASLRWTCGS
jgi:hypothetical protein